MRVVLVGPELEENLALASLHAALCRAGHACTILPFNRAEEEAKVARRILRHHPRLVGLSLVAQRRYPEYQRLVDRLRAHGFDGHITAGGHFAGLRAAEVLRDTPGIDTILHHDGEERLVRLAGAIARSAGREFQPPAELDGVSWRSAAGEVGHRAVVRVAELDDLPVPSRGRAQRTLGYPLAPLVTSRGCSGSCSFCSIHAWHRQAPQRRLRFRSPAAVSEEMIALHRAHGTRVFVFHDDDFIHPDPREARHRCRAILDPVEREIGPIAFVVKCRPDDVEPELFAALKARGLVRAYVGIESHSRAGLRALNRKLTPETNERALALLRSLEVYACFNLLVFHPDSNPEELEENLAFLERHLEVPFDVARAELYARSALEERMVGEGRARGDYRGYDYRIADPAAERTFRLFSELLWERHFGGRSILHRAQELGYRLSLLRRFQPRMVSPELDRRVAALIQDVNADTVEYLRRLVQAAAGDAPPSTLGAFRREFAAEVAARGRRRARVWRQLSWEVEGLARWGRLGERLGRATGAGSGMIERLARLAPGASLLLGAACSPGEHIEICDPPPPPAVSFAADIEPVLESTCARAECHAGESPEADLNLESGRSYDSMVDVPSVQVPGLRRVQPFWADSSYVAHKLRGTQAMVGGSGERMPRSGTLPGGFAGKFERWIDEGASREPVARADEPPARDRDPGLDPPSRP